MSGEDLPLPIFSFHNNGTFSVGLLRYFLHTIAKRICSLSPPWVKDLYPFN